MTGIPADLRYTFRTLARSPLFTFAAVLSLALGIGANTAIFTLMDQLMLRLLPVKDPEQLVMIWSTGPHMGSNRGDRAQSYPMYQEYQKRAKFFSHVVARYLYDSSLSEGGQTERITTELVSGNYFQALGVRPALGRLFTPEQDDRVYNGHPVVVLGYDYWISRFGGKADVLGRKVLVNSYPMEVVGVSGPGFRGLDPVRSPQIRVPIQMKAQITPGWVDLGNHRSQWLQMFARLAPGETVASAKAKLQPLFQQELQYEVAQGQLKEASKYYIDLFLKRQVRVEPAGSGYSSLRNSFSTALLVLMGMVALVLLIACANVASLLIARALARQKELAVRLAIGASRGQLIRQMLAESLMLSLAGAVAGILLSIWTLRGLISFLPAGDTPLLLRAEPDLRILGFNLALGILTGLLFGIAPAFHATSIQQWSILKDVASAVSTTGGGVKLRKGLVAAQVALSFLLLAGAALFVQSLSNLKRADTGFDGISNLVTFQVDPALNGYKVERGRQFLRELLSNVRGLPGVQSAGLATVALLHGDEWDSSMSVEGHQNKDGEDIQAFMNAVSPGYFSTMGVSLMEGRDFTDSDVVGSHEVAIVNQKFAEYYFGKKSPIGRHVGFGGSPGTKLEIEIVGVTENTLYEGPREGIRRQVFLPRAQFKYPAPAVYYVRTKMDSQAMMPALREAVRRQDPTMPVFEMRTLENQLDQTLATERLIAALSMAFGVLATILAAVGLYGVMAFVAARRIREVGLRMALGARPAQVLVLMMREVFVLLGIGLAVGLPCAYGLSRYVSSQMFQVKTADPWTALGVTVFLSVVALSAGFLPAWRASSIDPMKALRYE
jgi:predicted permease